MDLHEAYCNLILAMDKKKKKIGKFAYSDSGFGSLGKIKVDTIDECQAMVRHHLGEVIKDAD